MNSITQNKVEIVKNPLVKNVNIITFSLFYQSNFHRIQSKCSSIWNLNVFRIFFRVHKVLNSLLFEQFHFMYQNCRMGKIFNKKSVILVLSVFIVFCVYSSCNDEPVTLPWQNYK